MKRIILFLFLLVPWAAYADTPAVGVKYSRGVWEYLRGIDYDQYGNKFVNCDVNDVCKDWKRLNNDRITKIMVALPWSSWQPCEPGVACEAYRVNTAGINLDLIEAIEAIVDEVPGLDLMVNVHNTTWCGGAWQYPAWVKATDQWKYAVSLYGDQGEYQSLSSSCGATNPAAILWDDDLRTIYKDFIKSLIAQTYDMTDGNSNIAISSYSIINESVTAGYWWLTPTSTNHGPRSFYYRWYGLKDIASSIRDYVDNNTGITQEITFNNAGSNPGYEKYIWGVESDGTLLDEVEDPDNSSNTVDIYDMWTNDLDMIGAQYSEDLEEVQNISAWSLKKYVRTEEAMTFAFLQAEQEDNDGSYATDNMTDALPHEWNWKNNLSWSDNDESTNNYLDYDSAYNYEGIRNLLDENITSAKYKAFYAWRMGNFNYNQGDGQLITLLDHRSNASDMLDDPVATSPKGRLNRPTPYYYALKDLASGIDSFENYAASSVPTKLECVLGYDEDITTPCSGSTYLDVRKKLLADLNHNFDQYSGVLYEDGYDSSGNLNLDLSRGSPTTIASSPSSRWSCNYADSCSSTNGSIKAFKKPSSPGVNDSPVVESTAYAQIEFPTTADASIYRDVISAYWLPSGVDLSNDYFSFIAKDMTSGTKADVYLYAVVDGTTYTSTSSLTINGYWQQVRVAISDLEDSSQNSLGDLTSLVNEVQVGFIKDSSSNTRKFRIDDFLITSSTHDLDYDGTIDTSDSYPWTPDAEGDIPYDDHSDSDGIADVVDNCISVSNATQADADNDGIGNDCDADDDGDGISDVDETNTVLTNPLDSDSDDDGLMDGLEDINADGYVDSGETDPLINDTDKDGLFDGHELYVYGSNPLVADTNPFLLVNYDSYLADDPDLSLSVNTTGTPADDDSLHESTYTGSAGQKWAVLDQDQQDKGYDYNIRLASDNTLYFGMAGFGGNTSTEISDSDASTDPAQPTWDRWQWSFEYDNSASAYVLSNALLNKELSNIDDTTSKIWATDEPGTDNEKWLVDFDDDSDAINNLADNCPNVANQSQTDTDSDGIGDVCDWDIDGDGALDKTVDENGTSTSTNYDACPLDSGDWQTNTDGDDWCDVTDTDDDNDGVADISDAFPLDPNESADTDSDGIGDNGDNCPSVSNASQNDFNGDGEGDLCDPVYLKLDGTWGTLSLIENGSSTAGSLTDQTGDTWILINLGSGLYNLQLEGTNSYLALKWGSNPSPVVVYDGDSTQCKNSWDCARWNINSVAGGLYQIETNKTAGYMLSADESTPSTSSEIETITSPGNDQSYWDIVDVN